jgi:hypothetical protein
MRRFAFPSAVACALLAGVAFHVTPALAASRCDSPQGAIEQRACAKAAEGPDALRRFVERTRMIYGLYYYDFARGDDAVVSSRAAAGTRLAGVVTRSSAPRPESPR